MHIALWACLCRFGGVEDDVAEAVVATVHLEAGLEDARLFLRRRLAEPAPGSGCEFLLDSKLPSALEGMR